MDGEMTGKQKTEILELLSDTGASTDIIGEDLAGRFELAVHSTPGRPRGADGYTYQVKGITRVCLEITG